MKVAIITTDSREHYRDYTNPVPSFGTAPEALLQGFARRQDIEVHVLSAAQKPMSSPEKLADNIWFHGLYVPKIGWMRTLYQGCIRATRKKLQEIRPDIVHGQGTERDCALSAVFSGFPNVITIHGNMRLVSKINQAPPFSFDWLSARLESFTLPKTDGVFCNSKITEELVRPVSKQTWLVPNALRAKFFTPPRPGEPHSKPVLLNIGVICSRKAQNEILEMAERMHQRGARFELQLVGRVNPDAYGVRFRQLVEKGNKAGYVNYLGEKSTEELIRLMDNADALLHAPREESFGLVVAEGFARNLKLFGFKVGGLLDISDGVAGAELAEAGDFTALENMLIEWLSAGAPRMSGGTEKMRERYHPDVVAKQHVAIYRSVLDAAEGRSEA